MTNFSLEILEYCESNKEILLEREQYYLDLIPLKYNIYPTAGSPLGSKLSEETREKMSEAKKGENNYSLATASF